MSEVLIKPFGEEDKTISDVFIKDEHILNKCLDNIKKYKYLSTNNNFFEYDIKDNLRNELLNFYSSLNGNKRYIDEIKKELKVSPLSTNLKSELIYYIQNEQNNQINLLEIYLHIIFFYKEALNNKTYSYKENDIYKYFQYVYLMLHDFNKYNFNDFITIKDSIDNDNVDLKFIQKFIVKFLEVAYIETLYSQPIYSILSINKLRNENIKIIDFKPLYETFIKYNSRNKEIEYLFKQYDIDIYKYIDKNNIFYNIKISDDDVKFNENISLKNIFKDYNEQILKYVKSNFSFDDELNTINQEISNLETKITELQQNPQNSVTISRKELLQQQIDECNDTIKKLKTEITLKLNLIKLTLQKQKKDTTIITNIINNLEHNRLFTEDYFNKLKKKFGEFHINPAFIYNCTQFNTAITNKSKLERELSTLNVSVDLKDKLEELNILKEIKEKLINDLQLQKTSEIYNNLKLEITKKQIINTPQDNDNISILLDIKNIKLLEVFSICNNNNILSRLPYLNEIEYFDYMLKFIINNKIKFLFENNDNFTDIFINRFIMNIYSIYKYYKTGMILSDDKQIYIPIPKSDGSIIFTEDKNFSFISGQNQYKNFKQYMILFNSITNNLYWEHYKKDPSLPELLYNIDSIYIQLSTAMNGGKDKFDFTYNYDQLLFQISYYLKCIIKNNIIQIDLISKKNKKPTENIISFTNGTYKHTLFKNDLENSLYREINNIKNDINELELQIDKYNLQSAQLSFGPQRNEIIEIIREINKIIEEKEQLIKILYNFYNEYIKNNMELYNYNNICDYVGSLSLFNNQYNQPISVSNYRNIFNINKSNFQSFIININDSKYNIPLHKTYPSKYMIYLLKNTKNSLYKNILLSNLTPEILNNINNLDYIYLYNKPCLIDDQSNCYEIGSNEYKSYNEIIETSKVPSKKRQRGNTDDESALKQSTKEDISKKRLRPVVDSDDEEEDKDDTLDVSSIINDKVVIIILRDNKYDYNSKLNMTLISSNYTDYEIRIPLNVQFKIDPKKLNYVFVYYNDILHLYDCVYILSVDINNETNKISMNGIINQKYITNLNNFVFDTDSIMLNKKDKSVDSGMNGGKYKTLNKKYYYYLNKYNLI